jgi:hypothetical protein
MRADILAAIGILLLAGTSTGAHAQGSAIFPAQISPPMACNGGPDYFVTGVGHQTPTVAVRAGVQSARPLADQNTLISLLNQAAGIGVAKCPANPIVEVFIDKPGMPMVAAWMNRADGQWHIVRNGIAQAVQQEDANDRAAAARAEQERQAAADAAAAVQRKQAAIADCGAEPTFSGGPWFSSTYKTAAIDMGRRPPPDGRFLCVKTIEYIGAAVNPFGGNAARAKFTGYDAFAFQPLSMVMDFPY